MQIATDSVKLLRAETHLKLASQKKLALALKLKKIMYEEPKANPKEIKAVKKALDFATAAHRKCLTLVCILKGKIAEQKVRNTKQVRQLEIDIWIS